MLQYLSNALNDFLTVIPLCYTVTDSISMPPTAQFTALPSDCMFPVRVSAFGIGLRETSQSNLDGYDWRWEQQTGSPPQVYYRDKIGLQNVGMWPRQNNTTPLEVVYANRGQQLMGPRMDFPYLTPLLPTCGRVCWSIATAAIRSSVARRWRRFGTRDSRPG